MAGLTWLAKAGDLLDKLDKTAAETIAAAGDDDDFDDEDIDDDIERLLNDGAEGVTDRADKSEEAEGHDDAQAQDGDVTAPSKGSASTAKANSRDSASRYDSAYIGDDIFINLKAIVSSHISRS